MCILASCIAAQGQAEFRTMLAGALNAGVTPVEAKEVLYQAVPYVGMAKVLDFVHIANDVLVRSKDSRRPRRGRGSKGDWPSRRPFSAQDISTPCAKRPPKARNTYRITCR